MITVDAGDIRPTLRALSDLEGRSSRRRAVRTAMRPGVKHLRQRMKSKMRARAWPAGVSKAVGTKTRNKGDLTLMIVGVRGRQRVRDTNRQPGQRTHRLAGNVGHDEETGRGRPRNPAVKPVADTESRPAMAMILSAFAKAIEDEAERAALKRGSRRARPAGGG